MAASLNENLERYETSVILKDGAVLRLRPIRPDDRDNLISLFGRLSPHTIYLRFHHVLTRMSQEEARRFAEVDYDRSFALVGTVGEGAEEEIIAVGRYYRRPKTENAEVAFLVEDRYQGKGIGTHLLEQLASIARQKGICVFEAEVLAENKDMLKVFIDSGFELVEDLEAGVCRVIMPLAPTPLAEEKSAEREKLAAVTSLRAFLQPDSIAVIGASNRRGSIGNVLFRNLLVQNFNGVVYPVNSRSSIVASVKAYSSVLDIPGEVDLAVIAVRADLVKSVIYQCGRKGVKGLVIISAGFAETGEEGKIRQDEILKLARSYGMRLVGPNCMGIINADPEVNMNATFSQVFPPSGNIALATQSGALGLAILEYALILNMGLSTFVSMGNRADVSSNDLLQYWEDDPHTDVVLLYLESFGNPARFARVARRVSSTKPIVAVKSGRTAAGSRAAASHTGALATTEVAAEALFAQAGIIRVDTLEELFDIANLLSNQPVPDGKRVAILTNGGGPGAMTADACMVRGLEVPHLSETTMSRLKLSLHTNASLENPVDMTAEATADQYSRALRVLLDDKDIDSVIVIFIPPIVTAPEAVAGSIREIAPAYRQHGKTLLASFMGLRGASVKLGSEQEGFVPSFSFPEDTAAALAGASRYNEWRRKPKGVIPKLPDIDAKRGETIIASAFERVPDRPFWLETGAASDLLASYGIRLAKTVPAMNAKDAADAARRLGFPVAVKLRSSTITHKSDIGGVIIDVRSPEDVESAFDRIRTNTAAAGREDEMQGVIVQEMVPGGVEVIVGVTQDPSFGPLIMFGTGGIFAELYRDVVFRIHPLTDEDAREMVRSVKAFQLLEGYRGAEPADIEALEDLVLRVSAMVEDVPQICELDLNPVKVLGRGEGCVAVDARIMLK